jgi:hypothetical protein
MARCQFNKRSGEPCEGRAIGSNEGCWNHDPDFELDRRRNAKKGGKQGGRGRHNPGSADLHRLQSRFEDLAEQVLKEEIDRASAAVACQLLNGARSCVVASARVRELEDVERRLDLLEQGRERTQYER